MKINWLELPNYVNVSIFNPEEELLGMCFCKSIEQDLNGVVDKSNSYLIFRLLHENVHDFDYNWISLDDDEIVIKFSINHDDEGEWKYDNINLIQLSSKKEQDWVMLKDMFKPIPIWLDVVYLVCVYDNKKGLIEKEVKTLQNHHYPVAFKAIGLKPGYTYI